MQHIIYLIQYSSPKILPQFDVTEMRAQLVEGSEKQPINREHRNVPLVQSFNTCSAIWEE